MRFLSFRIVILLVFVAASLTAAGGNEDTPLLVDFEWLEANIDRDDLVLVDFGRPLEEYQAGHIPGARFVDRSSVYEEVDGVSGMLPGQELAIPHFEAAGISRESTVIIYDSVGGLWASRLFWGLEYFGHERVHVLDGGLPAWEASGRTLSTETPLVEVAEFEVTLRPQIVADSAFILDNLEGTDVQVIDARSPAEYLGSDVRAERGGHIPGAINIDWSLNLDDNRSFLSLQELGEFYDSNEVDKGKTQVAHCQTGVRGAHTYFVLRYLGYENVRLYDESWVVWGNDQNAPIETE
jgi:thiosulfate/3-mercaptopyruvate sulfurtransferase